MENKKQLELNNEYVDVLKLYMNVVDTLLYRDTMPDSSLCFWTKDNTYANFTVMAFKVLLKQQGKGQNYRYYMKIFRTLGWIICKNEKFSNVQWINGKSTRVITINYERYRLLETLLSKSSYFDLVTNFIRIVDKLMYAHEKTEKQICIWTKEGKIVNIKSENFRLLLEKEYKDLKEYMRYLRELEWIICQPRNFTNIQWLDGKPMRVISVDYEKYKLIKELLERY